MRVLLDVNILVRANEKASGPARRLLLELIDGGHSLLTSPDILIELGRVLRYPRVQALFGLSEEQIYEYIQFLRFVCEVVQTDMASNFPIRDVFDVPILRAAKASDSDVICTLDSDFSTTGTTAWCASMGIVVYDDISLLNRLRS